MRYFHIICIIFPLLFTSLPYPSTSLSTMAINGRLCDLPILRNGFVRRKQKGRVVEYFCSPSYKMVGNKFATCEQQRYDSPVPICVKAGCKDVAVPNNSYVHYTDDRTAVVFFCKTGYQPAGATEAYCDGNDWDRSLGNCRETHTGPEKFCDFETATICNWQHDPSHNFDWQRRTGTIKRTQRTGPRHDHSKKKILEGYFMLVESYGHLRADVARLMSPIYPANFSSGCFRFFYHMYGINVGRLRVYVKPLSVSIEEMLDEPKYLYFERHGNQLNLWHEGYFNMELLTEEFQIVIEGTIVNQLLGDIAIDDVELMIKEDECIRDKLTDSTTEQMTEETGGIYELQSCNNRCNETESYQNKNNSSIYINVKNSSGGVTVKCDCFEGCYLTQTCCLDYYEICLFSVTNINDLPTVMSSSQSPIKQLSTKLPATITPTKMTQDQPAEIAPTVATDKTTSILKEETNNNNDENDKDWKPLTNIAENFNDNNLLNSNFIIIITTVLLIIFLFIFLAVGFIWQYRRRNQFAGTNYKKNYNKNKTSKKSKNGSDSANEDISEVRYLTEEEYLDFNLATCDDDN